MEPLLRMLPVRPQPLAVRYGATSALVGLCFLTLMGLQGRSGLLAFYLLFSAIFAASVLFDRGSGVFATLLGAALVYLCRIPTIADSDCERLRTVIPIDCGQHSEDCGQVAPIDGFMGSLVGGCVKVATVKY